MLAEAQAKNSLNLMDKSCGLFILASWHSPELIAPSSEDSCKADTLLTDPPPPESSFPNPGLDAFFVVRGVVVVVVVVAFVVVVVEVVVVLVVVWVFVSGDVVFDFSFPKNTFQRGTWSLASSCTPVG